MSGWPLKRPPDISQDQRRTEWEMGKEPRLPYPVSMSHF